MDITLEQLAARMAQSTQEGVTTALATLAPAAPPADQTALSDRVVQEINALFQQEDFRNSLASAITQQEAELSQDDPEGDAAEMGARGAPLAGAIASLDNLGGFGLPLGSGFVGVFLGLTTSKIVDRFAAPKNADGSTNFINPAVKVGAAWASMSFLPRFLGRPASLFLSGYLLVDALRVVLPIDEWATKLANLVPTGGTAVAQGRLRQYRARQLNGYAPNGGYAGMLPSAPTAQVVPGYGGAGEDPLKNVIG